MGSVKEKRRCRYAVLKKYKLSVKDERIKAGQDPLDEILEVAQGLRAVWNIIKPVVVHHSEVTGKASPIPEKFKIEKILERIERLRKKKKETK